MQPVDSSLLHMSKRREFLSKASKGVGLAALATAAPGSLWNAEAASLQKVSRRTDLRPTGDEDFWFEIQQAFPYNRALLNLNNAGTSPSPRIVTEAFCEYTRQQDDIPIYTMLQVLEPRCESIRQGIALEFGCDPEEIAITRNASESLEICLFGMDLKPGDEVLTTTQDYPRMIATLKQREFREGIVLKQIRVPIAPKSLNQITSAFEEAITPKTKVVLVSHMINVTGQITPTKAICELGRSKGIEVVVDGAQTFAHLDFKQKDLNCDYYGTSLHKWLFAPKGTGFLYVKREKIEKLWSLMGTEKKQTQNIRKFEEIGTHSAAMKLAIGEALLFHQGIGAQRKQERLRTLRNYWVNQLKSIPKIHFNTSFEDNQSCCLANFELQGIDSRSLTAHLKAKNIVVTPIIHPEFQGVRISPSVYTTFPELDRFCAVVEDVAKKGLPTG